MQECKKTASSSVKMAAPLATCTKEEQRSVIRFLLMNGWNPSKFMDEWKFSTVMHVCHYKCASGLGSSWSLSGPTNRCSRRCTSGCGPAKRIFFLEVSTHFRSAGTLVWNAMETALKNEVTVYILHSINCEIKNIRRLRFSFDSPSYVLRDCGSFRKTTVQDTTDPPRP
jgi:hypothetical protein